MFDIKACTVCLKTNVKIYSLNTDQLRHEYNLVSGLMVGFCIIYKPIVF